MYTYPKIKTKTKNMNKSGDFIALVKQSVAFLIGMPFLHRKHQGSMLICFPNIVGNGLFLEFVEFISCTKSKPNNFF